MDDKLVTDLSEHGGLPTDQAIEFLPRIWVEKTLVQDRSDRQEGPHRLGVALWSPQRGSDGRDTYANMREVKVGDVVMHLTDNEAITGISIVAEPLDTGFAGVVGTKWASGPCYRIALRDFCLLDPPLRREWFFGDPEIGERLRFLSTQPRGRGLFFNGKLELNQGLYLTEAPPSLVAALDAAYVSHTGGHIPMLPAAMLEAGAVADAEDNLGVPERVQPTAQRRSWVYSPGQQAVYWDEFYQGGIMALGWDDIGDFESLKTIEDFRKALEENLGSDKDQGQNARMCFDFAHTMHPGDIVYAKRGRQTFVGRGIVEGEYRHDSSRSELTNVRRVRWTARGEWPSPDKLPMKTLTEWTAFPALLEKIEGLVTEVSAGYGKPLPPAKPAAERQPYSVDDALDGLFMRRDEFTRLVDNWRKKKNLILQGAPGVGKTFVARRLAYALMGYKDPTRVRTVQFHQSYGYEDFVQGYRPSGSGFILREGVFLNFCARALEDPSEQYVFIIDEINRGNLSRILGELMLLIEPDKRSPEWAVKLAYAEKAEERFYVPSNVFILGMMNTADRSLAVVDYALRRRFAFATILPAFGESAFRAYLLNCGVVEALADQLIDRMMALNAAIAADTTNLGRGYCIGQSFFTPVGDGEHGLHWYNKVVETEIVPLLEEYWFDQPDKVEQWRAKLLA
jgi:5-methylcytosine-specific restriction protein B